MKRLLAFIVLFATCAALLMPTAIAAKPRVDRRAYTLSLRSTDGIWMYVSFHITNEEVLPSPTVELSLGPLYEKYHYRLTEFIDWHWSWSHASFITRVNLSDYDYHWNPNNQTYRPEGVSLLEVNWQATSQKETTSLDHHDCVSVVRQATASARLGDTTFQADFAALDESRFRR